MYLGRIYIRYLAGEVYLVARLSRILSKNSGNPETTRCTDNSCCACGGVPLAIKIGHSRALLEVRKYEPLGCGASVYQHGDRVGLGLWHAKPQHLNAMLVIGGMEQA